MRSRRLAAAGQRRRGRPPPRRRRARGRPALPRASLSTSAGPSPGQVSATGFCWRTIAAAPATCGAAKEVPLPIPWPDDQRLAEGAWSPSVVSSLRSETMWRPGASRSGRWEAVGSEPAGGRSSPPLRSDRRAPRRRSGTGRSPARRTACRRPGCRRRQRPRNRNARRARSRHRAGSLDRRSGSSRRRR